MNYSKIIEMDIWSTFGCFSKPFSTIGGVLSYMIPPKTTVIGMIGAILGYEFDEFNDSVNSNVYDIEELYDIKISIQPLFDLKSKRVTFNKVEGTIENTKILNIHQDVLINPYYKLFISFPDHLSEKEKVFIDRIKNHETIFNLYMGRNEFILSYKLCRIFNYESIILNKNNMTEFFNNDCSKVFGSLNRKLIKETELVSTINDGNINENKLLFKFNNSEKKLKSFYEYIINDYPIKRSNFTDFKYSVISFYSAENLKDCYFSKLIFKDDVDETQFLELTKIGENEWISMI